jgi:hypothetical protein
MTMLKTTSAQIETQWACKYMAVGLSFTAEGAELRRKIEERYEIDFGRFSRNSGTIIAHLRWKDDGSCYFEGLTGTHTLTRTPEMSDVAMTDRVLAHWEGFIAAQREQQERDDAARRASYAKQG